MAWASSRLQAALFIKLLYLPAVHNAWVNNAVSSSCNSSLGDSIHAHGWYKAQCQPRILGQLSGGEVAEYLLQRCTCIHKALVLWLLPYSLKQASTWRAKAQPVAFNYTMPSCVMPPLTPAAKRRSHTAVCMSKSRQPLRRLIQAVSIPTKPRGMPTPPTFLVPCMKPGRKATPVSGKVCSKTFSACLLPSK